MVVLVVYFQAGIEIAKLFLNEGATVGESTPGIEILFLPSFFFLFLLFFPSYDIALMVVYLWVFLIKSP